MTNENLYTIYSIWTRKGSTYRVGIVPIIKKTAKQYRVKGTSETHFTSIVRISEVDCGGLFFTAPELAIRNAQDKAQQVVKKASEEFDKMLALKFTK